MRPADDEIDTEKLLEELACEEPKRIAREALAKREEESSEWSSDWARRLWATTIQQFPRCFTAEKETRRAMSKQPQSHGQWRHRARSQQR